MDYNNIGIDALAKRLETKKTRIDLRYDYYDMKNAVWDFEISTPPGLRDFQAVMGWAAKGVDSLADRLSIRGFGGGDFFGMERIYALNNKDVLFDSAILGALISACSFIYISRDENGLPRLQAIDGGNATGVIDPITSMLHEGYAVLERDKNDRPTLEAYFTHEETLVFLNDGRERTLIAREDNPAPWALLVPVIYRPSASRPFGHSRISRAAMGYIQSASRTLKRSEIAAEFYSYPQKWIVGTDDAQTQGQAWRASMSSFFEITKGEDGDLPKVGQFTAASMEPHLSQLRMIAALFAGETGLTLDDLGFATENPSSAEAIKASHENLRLAARKAQKDFAVGIKNAGYLAACVRDDTRYLRTDLADTTVLWEPIFESDASMLAGIGDGLAKLEQQFPGYITADKLKDLIGF